MTHKQCKKCNIIKPVTEYYFYKDRQDYGSACKECRKKDVREYAKINKEKISENKKRYREENIEIIKQRDKKRYHKHKDKAREWWLRRNYGITQEQFDKMVSDQNGKCAICFSKPANNKTLVVDHCHTTEKVRSLLCNNCNTGLGLFKEDVSRLSSAIKYLTDFSAV